MSVEREAEIPLEKTYKIPNYRIVSYNGFFLAVMVDIARWIVLKNETQLKVLDALMRGLSVGNVLEVYGDSDVQSVLLQIEAIGIERLKPRSIFSNTRLHLHLTNQCNMCCPHCYVRSQTAYANELSTDEVKNLCCHFRETGGTDVSLTGGEPTLRTDFFEIVEFISRLGMKVSVYTNGLNWTEEKIRRLASNSLEGVQISIDGYDEQTNSTIRNKGSFAHALETVDLMIKNTVQVKIAITPPFDILVGNCQKYVDFARGLLNKYGSSHCEINFSYALMPGREMSADFVNGIREKYRSCIDEIVRALWPNAKEDSFVTNISDCIYDSCGYGGLNVLANGDFYFCDRLSDVACNGNVREMPFNEIRRLMALAEEAGKIDHFKPCKECELKYICGGGCRVEHFRQFTQVKNIEDVDHDAIAPRICSKDDKGRLYDLMLRTTEMFYR